MMKNSHDKGRFLILCWDVLSLTIPSCVSFQLPLKRILLGKTELRMRTVELSLPKLIAFIVDKNSLCLGLSNSCRKSKLKAVTVSRGNITFLFCCWVGLNDYCIFNVKHLFRGNCNSQCCRVAFEKLMVAQLVKKFLAFYGTRTFITFFPLNPILSQMNSVHILFSVCLRCLI